MRTMLAIQYNRIYTRSVWNKLNQALVLSARKVTTDHNTTQRNTTNKQKIPLQLVPTNYVTKSYQTPPHTQKEQQ